MEIIRRGIAPGERSYTGTCATCRTELRFKQSEAKHSPDQRDGGYYVDCPVCRGSVWGRQEPQR